MSYIAELAPSAEDDDILSRALDERCVLLTEDRDFCELVFRDKKPTYGIVLVRIPARHREQKARRITELMIAHAVELPNAMTTLTLNDIRIRSLSEPSTVFDGLDNSLE